MGENGSNDNNKNVSLFDHIDILHVHQLATRITIPILCIYLLNGVLRYDQFSDSYKDDCYAEVVFRFRISTLFLIFLGYFTPYLTTHVFSGGVELSYLSLITLIITTFHWLDGAGLKLEHFYVTFALVLIVFHPYLYGPISLGHIHDSLYIQCAVVTLLTSTAVLFSSLTLLTDRLDFFWKVPIPFYIINYLTMMLSSLTNLLPITRPAIRCN